jgi:signal transduction histidine kinase
MSRAPASERYRVVDRIGEGGIGVVYRVEDAATGDVRAMKVIPRKRGVANLRGEFLALARLHHENIVRVHDYGLTKDRDDFFTMDFVSGPALAEAVPNGASPALYPVLGGVLRALAFLHARGIVHADIKPSNILIDAKALADEPMAAAKLVDFGLAANLSDPRASASRGTFPYAAPEVYAGRLDARSDLYALGVVLYELVYGAKPWDGDDVGATLAAQRRGPPADPRSLRDDVPDGLSELILALLDPIPSARPQTADEVLARLNDIGGTNFAVAVADHRPLVDIGGTLVGRDRDVAELERLLDEARGGHGAVVVISGEEGIGKSRLMAELKLRAQTSGDPTYAVSVANVTGAAHPGIAELVRSLLADLGARRKDNDALAPLFGERTDSDLLDPQARYALAEAVAAIVLEVARHRPIVIEIDDAHEADPGTLELIAYLARAVSAGRVLLVIAAQRNVASTPRLRAITEPTYAAAPGRAARDATGRLSALAVRLRHGHQIDLPPLDGQSIRALVTTAFGDDIARTLAPDLHRASGGNPSHAAHALRALVEAGAIVRKRGRWAIPETIRSIPLPATAVTAARARVEALPDASRDVLHAAAVLGERFRIDVLADVIEDPDADVTAALVDAAAARVVGADIGAGWFYFSHREVASALYADLPRDERHRLHQRAAVALAARVDAGETIPPDALATHYLALNDRGRGADWSMRAARARAEVNDPHTALQWLERARALVDDGGADAATIDEQMGDLRGVLGDVEMACADLRRAFDATESDPARHIAIGRRLAELLRRRGEGPEASAIVQRSLALARKHTLRVEEAMCQLMLGQVLMYQADYTAAMEHAVAGHLIARSQKAHSAAAGLGRLRASIEIYQGDAVGALRDLEASLADAEAGGSELDIAEVRFGIGRAAVHTGDYPRAIESYEAAIPVFERHGYVQKLASSINNLGAAYYFQGAWDKCRERWEQFRDLCQRLDEQSEYVNALNNLGLLYRDLGELSEAMDTLDLGAAVAEQVNHKHMAAMILGNRGDVLFRQADLAGARACYEQALSQFSEIGANVDIIENKRRLSEVDIALGRINEAIDRAIDTIREAQDAGSKFEEGILHRVAASALRAQGDVESARWFCGRARELLGELGAGFELAKVDLEAGEIEAAAGKPEAADEHLAKAADAFAGMGARWHLTRTRTRRRAIKPADRAAGNAASRGEVLMEVSQATGRITLDELLTIVLDKILALTGFDRGFILLLDRDGRPSERMRRTRDEQAPGFGRDDAVFSASIVRRVAASGESMAVTDIADDVDLRDQASIVSLGLRQVMCVPMLSRGRIFGIVYVDSRGLMHEEREADLALLEALSSQASIAIENARLAEEERRKTELMGILAHEIRNPLAGILGFSSPEAITDLGEAPDLLRHIHRDAQRLKRLLDNILELTRHETGDAEWSMGPFELEPLLTDVRDSYLAATRERSIKFDLVVEPGCTALGNADRVFQVVTNLVANAVKFAPDGTTITLAARREVVRGDEPEAPPAPPSDVQAWAPMEDVDAERSYVRVDVADEGPGMSDEARARMFDKFAQGSKMRSKGVGLGLYISREIIDRHGGTIWVDSELGHGATFSFRIPADN